MCDQNCNSGISKFGHTEVANQELLFKGLLTEVSLLKTQDRPY